MASSALAGAKGKPVRVHKRDGMDAWIKPRHDDDILVQSPPDSRAVDGDAMTTNEDDESELRALFTAYAEGFDDADAAVVTALFAWPATIWQFGEGHVFEDAEDLSENVDALIDVFDEAGIVSTEPEVKEVRVAGPSAFASVTWRQRDTEGELLHEFACQYLLVKQASGWRIATVVNEESA